MWYDRWVRFNQWRERTYGSQRLLLAFAGIVPLTFAIYFILDSAPFFALWWIALSSVLFLAARYMPILSVMPLWSEAIGWMIMLMLFAVGIRGLFWLLF